VDFYAPSIRLAIEVDGPHHDLPEQRVKDRIRQRWIEDTAGVEFMRFSTSDVCNWPDKVVAEIEARLKMKLAAEVAGLQPPPQISSSPITDPAT
jgi:very-short-patch-repair endonuclease